MLISVQSSGYIPVGQIIRVISLSLCLVKPWHFLTFVDYWMINTSLTRLLNHHKDLTGTGKSVYYYGQYIQQCTICKHYNRYLFWLQFQRVTCSLQKMQTNEKLSVGRMFSVQDSLPKLPVPPLDQTLQKYLRSVRPLLTDDEYANTQKVIIYIHTCCWESYS